MEKIEQKVNQTLDHVGDNYPAHAGKDGIYQYRQSDWWTSGFWPGILWILYDVTGKEHYKHAAWNKDEELEKWFIEPTDELNHDVGFQFLPTAVIKHTLTGDKDAMRRGIKAANFLAARFNPEGGFIRAWDKDSDGNSVPGWAIVDCLMNIPLLFWASRVTGDPRYKHIAIRHADTFLQFGIREDGSVSHILSFDPTSGSFLESVGGQGYAPDSSWSRGTAWALYGYLLAYRYTGELRFLNASKRVAHFFIASLPEDHVPYWDFRLECYDDEPRDSSAAAIAASGLLEIADVVPTVEKRVYAEAAERLLYSLTENHATWNQAEHQAILTGATGNRPCNHHVDYSLIFGDYYYVEAFAKLNGWRHRIF
ncbi:glycoside hydrolase family 88 protein [Ectobacillus funiculus]|uniref:glycoside hydrolase family 88 protein n=1 Tax=Ectobacillus funiculus TaxID=137993 RepID=UPI00397C9188